MNDAEKHEQALSVEEQQPRVSLPAILSAMADQVFAFDGDGRFTYFHSPDPERLFAKPEDFIGRRASEIMPPEVARDFERALEANRQGRLAEYDYSLPLGDKEHWFHARLSPIMRDGEFQGSVAVVRDITGLVQGQQEQLRLEAELAQAHKLESLGLLAGSVAHDFNNLLMSVLGHADLALLEEGAGEVLTHHMQRIRRAAQEAADLTQQLLAYAGRGERETQRVDLGQMVLDMSELLRVNLPDGVNLLLDCMGPTDPVQADPTQVRQVAMNLVSNAIEAMGDRKGSIKVSVLAWRARGDPLPGCATGAPPPAGPYTVLQVEDEGCGMDNAVAQRIFEPFFSTKFTGRGVGLATVLGIVRAHAGFIQVDSQVDRGTTFRIGLPAAQEQPATPRVEGEQVGEEQFEGRVLLVDDEDEVRSIAASMLERLGLEVVEASDGARALQLLEESPTAYLFVLLDLTMPGLNGLQVLKRIRTRTRTLPVLLSSGFGQRELSAHMTQGPAAFISKPYRLQQLRESISRMLALRPEA